jgi:hypothetical protein
MQKNLGNLIDAILAYGGEAGLTMERILEMGRKKLREADMVLESVMPGYAGKKDNILFMLLHKLANKSDDNGRAMVIRIVNGKKTMFTSKYDPVTMARPKSTVSPKKRYQMVLGTPPIGRVVATAGNGSKPLMRVSYTTYTAEDAPHLAAMWYFDLCPAPNWAHLDTVRTKPINESDLQKTVEVSRTPSFSKTYLGKLVNIRTGDAGVMYGVLITRKDGTIKMAEFAHGRAIIEGKSDVS